MQFSGVQGENEIQENNVHAGAGHIHIHCGQRLCQ